MLTTALVATLIAIKCCIISFCLVVLLIFIAKYRPARVSHWEIRRENDYQKNKEKKN